MTKEIRVVARRDGEEYRLRVRFAKIHDERGRHGTSCAIVREIGQGDERVLAYGFARLGTADLGRYNFWAGCRIALVRALERMVEIGYPLTLARPLRRGLQVELALARNDAEGYATGRKLNGLAVQRQTLLGVKATLLGRRASDLMDEDIAQRERDAAKVARRVDAAFLRGPVTPAQVISHFIGELERKPEAYKASAPSASGPSALDNWAPHGIGRPTFPACESLLTGNDDNPVPADCAECQGDPACCQKIGGL